MTQIVDQVGFGSNGAFGEGQRLTAVTTNIDRGFERPPGGGAGHVDTNDNATDRTGNANDSGSADDTRRRRLRAGRYRLVLDSEIRADH